MRYQVRLRCTFPPAFASHRIALRRPDTRSALIHSVIRSHELDEPAEGMKGKRKRRKNWKYFCASMSEVPRRVRRCERAKWNELWNETVTCECYSHRRVRVHAKPFQSYVDQCLASCVDSTRTSNVRAACTFHQCASSSTLTFQFNNCVQDASAGGGRMRFAFVAKRVSGDWACVTRRTWKMQAKARWMKMDGKRKTRTPHAIAVLVWSRPCMHTNTHSHKIYGIGGWIASTFRMHTHVDMTYRRRTAHQHTHTHTPIRTVFIACDAKRPPIPMQQTHRLGTEFVSLSGVLILNF